MEPANARAGCVPRRRLRLHRLENARRRAESLTESTEQPVSVQIEARALLANITCPPRFASG
jgi:hypothetical protein